MSEPKDNVLASDTKIDMSHIFEFFEKHYPSNEMRRLVEVGDHHRYDRIDLRMHNGKHSVSIHFSCGKLAVMTPRHGHKKGEWPNSAFVSLEHVTEVSYVERPAGDGQNQYFVQVAGGSGLTIAIYPDSIMVFPASMCAGEKV